MSSETAATSYADLACDQRFVRTVAGRTFGWTHPEFDDLVSSATLAMLEADARGTRVLTENHYGAIKARLVDAVRAYKRQIREIPAMVGNRRTLSLADEEHLDQMDEWRELSEKQKADRKWASYALTQTSPPTTSR